MGTPKKIDMKSILDVVSIWRSVLIGLDDLIATDLTGGCFPKSTPTSCSNSMEEK